MKAVMISEPPTICEKVANGDCTILVKKTRPKIDTPFKCYIYCTKDFKFNDFKYSLNFLEAYKRSGKVIGHFVCDEVYNLVQAGAGIMFATENLDLLEPQMFRDMSCLTDNQLSDYLDNKDGFGWHISNLVIYDEPKELWEFFTPIGKRPSYMIERPPQSWCYVEEKE